MSTGRRRKARDQESQSAPEQGGPAARASSDAPAPTRRGHARNGSTPANGGTAPPGGPVQRRPSQSSGDDEPLSARSRAHGTANGRARDAAPRGRTSTAPTAPSLARSDSAGSQSFAWRVSGYSPEPSQSPRGTRAGSVVSERSLSMYTAAERNGDPGSAGHHADWQTQSVGPSTLVEDEGPPVREEMVTVLINDTRYDDHGIAEIFIPTFWADNSLWVDARDVVEHLQLSPGKVDGPARVYVMRGGWKQYFLRVEEDGRILSGLANLKVEEQNTLKIHIDYIPQYAPRYTATYTATSVPLPCGPTEQGPSTHHSEPVRRPDSQTAPRARAESAAARVHYQPQAHAPTQPEAAAGRKRRYQSSVESVDARSQLACSDASEANWSTRATTGGRSVAASPTVSRTREGHVPTPSRPTVKTNLSRHPSAAESTTSAYPATSQSSTRLQSTQSAPDVLAAGLETRSQSAAPASPVVAAPSPVQTAHSPAQPSASPVHATSPVRSAPSPVSTEPATSPRFSPVQLAPSPAPAVEPLPVPPSPAHSTLDSSPPRPHAKKVRYNDDDSDSDLDGDAPRASQAQRTGTSAAAPTPTPPAAAPAPASGFSAFSKFAGTASAGAFASFAQRSAGFGTGAGNGTPAPAAGGATGMFGRTAVFGGSAAAATGDVVRQLRAVLAAEPAFDAFQRARADALRIAEQVEHWRFVKHTLERFVGKPLSANGHAELVTEDQVKTALGIKGNRAEEYIEALSLTAFYGPKGSRMEDEEVVKLYHEPCPVSSSLQLSRYLGVLRKAQERWLSPQA